MATRTNKSGQRKSLTIGLAAFASVCLIATGFAAWIISTKTEKKFDGNVAIGAVSNANVEITVDNKAQDMAFSFNPQSNDTTGRVRYDGTNGEKLGFTLTGTVGPERFVTSLTVRLDLAKEQDDGEAKKWVVDEDANKRFKDAVTANYITAPACFDQDVELFNSEDANYSYQPNAIVTNDSVAKFSAKIEFGWGDIFGGVNPGRYYDEYANGKKTSDADRLKTINGFYTTLTGVTDLSKAQDVPLHFLVTITAGTAQQD